jgi:cell division protein FtsW
MRVAVPILVFCAASLLGLGVVMLYSSTMTQNGLHLLVMQLLWGGLGLVGAVTLAAMDYRWLKRVWWLFLVAAIALLVAVLVPHVGVVRGGAQRWFRVGGLSFQPSEFAKLALLIFLAWYGERYQRKLPGFWRGLVVPGLAVAVVVGLIFKEPDVGNALVVAAVSGTMLLLAGARLRYLLPLAFLAVAAVGWYIEHNPVRSDRFYSWKHLEETRHDTGLQAYLAKVALGSGGTLGRGLGDSREKLGYLPQHHGDFIFAIIGEELGFRATVLILAAFVLMLLCGLYIGWRAADPFGLLLATGLSSLIALQALVNIGVVTSALPNKGIPLPFISHGGSNLLLMLLSVGLLVSIARRARPSAQEAMPEDLEDFQDENPFRARPGADAGGVPACP